MSQGSALSLARVSTERLEAVWRRLGALPAKTRVDEEQLGDPELVEVLEPLLGQPAWVLGSLLEAVLAERGNFSPPTASAGPKVEYRIDRHHGATSPELVWSGDTGRRSCARKTRYVIEDLFASASDRVLIAGYSFDHATDLFEPLFDRAEALAREGLPLPKVRVILDCSREPLAAGERADELARRVGKEFMQTCWRRDSLKAELLYYRPSAERTDAGRSLYSMHAKCVVVDGNVALVGSANFSNRGRDRNLEVGALIRDHHFVQSLLAAWDEVEDQLAPVPDEGAKNFG